MKLPGIVLAATLFVFSKCRYESNIPNDSDREICVISDTFETHEGNITGLAWGEGL
ncbi:MAG: hypothetical protein K8S15_10975 [Candidatus Aegiribacteria sp.]|nr:hypothetical protein [Candidatus Aegiribacteria sp.]